MVLYLRKVALRDEETGSKFVPTKYIWLMSLKFTMNDKCDRLVGNRQIPVLGRKGFFVSIHAQDPRTLKG